MSHEPNFTQPTSFAGEPPVVSRTTGTRCVDRHARNGAQRTAERSVVGDASSAIGASRRDARNASAVCPGFPVDR